MKTRKSLSHAAKVFFPVLMLLSMIIVVFISAAERSSHQKKSKSDLNKVKYPAIVVAIDTARCLSESVLLLDASGNYHSFGCNSDVAYSISASRKVGDTLK